MALFSKHGGDAAIFFFLNFLLSSPPSRLGCFPSQSWLFFLPQRQNLWVSKINLASLFQSATNHGA